MHIELLIKNESLSTSEKNSSSNTEYQNLLKIISLIDEVRLNLIDSSKQGFLYVAQANIRYCIQKNYIEE